ncbi:hypothetical protein PG996_014187 [Apiospora saccharicola]|uniref:CorA-like transporter domain-containing protein n=1 Tax=Apiospora saccharicola TaxID=335842 RepID=A0ABR1THL9_9PEZI
MAQFILPGEFAESYKAFEKYPLKLVSNESHSILELKTICKRLRERAQSLLSDQNTRIPVKDVADDGTALKTNICSDDDLKFWLGDASIPDSQDSSRQTGQVATKPDPRCRFISLVNDSVTHPLKISLKSLQRLLAYHQVSPLFLDFLDVYGSQWAKDRELRFSSFRTETCLINSEAGSIVDGLRRSGRRYQVFYNLKSVSEKPGNAQSGIELSWKIRQSAFHHQFDVGTGTQLWIFGDPHEAIKERISNLIPEQRNHLPKFDTVPASFKTSLDVHLDIGHWSMTGWRRYIAYLEERVEKLKLYYLEMGRQSPIDTDVLIEVQGCEDKTNETIMTLESNADNLESLSRFYSELVQDENFPAKERDACIKAVKKACSRIRELVYETRMQVRRAKILFIQLIQSKAASRAEGLSATMWRQAENSAQETIAMRVITVVTLLYLPPTFVSTLFSTDIVKYQGDDGPSGAEMFSWMALQRWLQVSLPLMLVTVLATFGWVWFDGLKVKAKAKRLEAEFPDVFQSSK